MLVNRRRRAAGGEILLARLTLRRFASCPANRTASQCGDAVRLAGTEGAVCVLLLPPTGMAFGRLTRASVALSARNMLPPPAASKTALITAVATVPQVSAFSVAISMVLPLDARSAGANHPLLKP
jgi:hypothetical protein